MRLGIGIGLNNFRKTGTGGTGPITSTSTQVAQGSVTFPFAAAYETGHYADGAAYVVAPSGLTMNAPTPAVSSEATGMINGVMVNPQYTLSGTDLAFDGRGTYNAANLATFPRVLSVGDMVVKAVSWPDVEVSSPYYEDMRRGLISEWAVCHVVAAHPAANAISPAPAGWSGRGTPVARIVDLNALMALRPRLTGSTYTLPDITELATRIDRFNAGLAMSHGVLSNSGYQTLCVRRMGGMDSNNYGPKIAEAYRDVAMHWMADTSDALVRPLIARMVQDGSWFYDTTAGSGLKDDGDGGHHQFHYIAMLFALVATGRTALISTLQTVAPENQLCQSFQFTSDLIARLAPHDNDVDPFSSRLRSISAISGNQITIESRLGGDPYHVNFADLVCRNAAGTVIGSVTVGGSSGNATSYTITLSSVAGLSVGNEVYFTAAYPIAVGDYNWTVVDVPSFNFYNSAPSASYRNINTYAVETLLARALGVYQSSIAPVEGQVVSALDAAKDMPSPFGYIAYLGATKEAQVKAFWDAHAVGLGVVFPSAAITPVNTAVPTVTGTTMTGQTLTASPGTWSNTPTAYAYQWQRSGANISGATASTYTLVTADVGQTVRVVVTATNAAGSAAENSAYTATITAAPLAYTLLENYDDVGDHTVTAGAGLDSSSRIVEGTAAMLVSAQGVQNVSITTTALDDLVAPTDWDLIAMAVDQTPDGGLNTISGLQPFMFIGGVSYSQQVDTSAGAILPSFGDPNTRGVRWFSIKANRLRQSNFAGAQLTSASSGIKKPIFQNQQSSSSDYNGKYKVDAMVRPTRHKPCVMWTLDDLNVGQYTDLRPILSSRGLTATIYAPMGLIDSGGSKLTTAQCLELKNTYGWSFSLDSARLDEPLTGFATVAAAISQLNDHRDELIASGLGDAASAAHLCYSYGVMAMRTSDLSISATCNGTTTVTVASTGIWGNSITAGMVVKGTGLATNPTVVHASAQGSAILSAAVASGTKSLTFCGNKMGLSVTCNGTTTIYCSTTALVVGQTMTGYGVPDGTTITAVVVEGSSGQITVSNAVLSTCTRANFLLKSGEFYFHKMQDALIAAGYKSARRIAVLGGIYTGFGLDPRMAMALPGYSIDSSIPAATREIADLLAHIENGQDTVTYMHATASQDYTHSAAVADFLQAKVSAGEVDVVSVAEWYRRVSARGAFA